jgi:aryl-alcohol dehydrogenase-like predicted oxidoreductase
MRTRPFGRKRFEVSELALGTWGLSGDAYGPVYHKEAERVIDRAAELGITLFETASVYGKGGMEKLLGERLKDKEGVRVVTKIGTQLDGDPPQKKFDRESTRVAFEQSRERLGRDKLDVVLLHNPSIKAVAKGEASTFLKEKVEAGELEAWGVSAGDWEVAEQAMQKGADVVQMAYNLFHQKDVHRISDRIASSETALMARSILSHGLLTGYWQKSRVFFDNDQRKKRWTREELAYRLAQLDAPRALVGGSVSTLRAVALRFVLSNVMVSTAVIGPRSTIQLNQIVLEAGEGPPYLEDDALLDLGLRLEKVGVEVSV